MARARPAGGRPTKYDAATAARLAAALAGGSDRGAAARAAGIAPSTLYAWLALGRAGHPGFAPLAEAAGRVAPRRLIGRVDLPRFSGVGLAQEQRRNSDAGSGNPAPTGG
jgi:transposase-like protein